MRKKGETLFSCLSNRVKNLRLPTKVHRSAASEILPRMTDVRLFVSPHGFH